jgi:TonB family protein
VIFETPQGEGFGGAALALRPTFKIPPPNDAAGADMNLAVRFTAARTNSNLSDVMARAREIGLDGMPGQANEGGRNVNASGLVVRGNPVPMRSVTLAETPVWREAPGFAEVAAAYPPEGGGVEGYGVAHCRVEPTGLLSRCKAVKESPEKRGFGAAAVALAVRFRLSAEDVARAPRGAPLEVDVPVRFPAPAEAADRVVRAPLWVAGAEPEAAARHFPTEAAAKGVTEGEAVVRCEVAEDGSLQGCAPERARPDGFGFDDAALKVAAGMRMIPWSADAGPVKGGVVHIPVRFERGPPTP